jgi:competence protein ComEC
LAVFAIVWIQPMLYRSWTPKHKIVDYFWQILTVTIAAQIGVAPLSLFYFHQFPGLFFISNLVIIPVLGLILGLGLLVIFLALIDALPEFIVKFYGGVITTLNNFVVWIAEQEAFLFKGISFGIITVLLSYLVIVFGVRVIQNKNFKRFVPFLLVILMIQGFTIYSKSKVSNSFTVFQKSRHSLIAFQKNDELKVLHSLDSAEIEKDYTITNYMIGKNISELSSDTLESVYKINDDILLVIDSIGAYKVSFKPDMILLRNSPKINLERLIKQYQPKLIIADGSNYKSYVSRWSVTCKRKKLPFHATAKKGALTIDYAN